MSLLDIEKDYNMLSLRDLVAARDLYHLHLMDKQHVVATAVGRFLIRKSEAWPANGLPSKTIDHICDLISC